MHLFYYKIYHRRTMPYYFICYFYINFYNEMLQKKKGTEITTNL